MTDNIFECIQIDIDDNMLENAKIASYMSNQSMPNSSGTVKPYNPKSFPDKAVVVQFQHGVTPIQIYLDTNENKWNSCFIVDDHIGKLSPEQMDDFFSTNFYKKLVDALSNKWPTSDPTYAKLFEAVMNCDASTSINEDEMHMTSLNEVDQPGKKVKYANQDVDGDNIRDYAGSGRKIVHFTDMGVSTKSGRYFCWPRIGKEFKWNSWCNWKRMKPFAKMTFKHNGRTYAVILNLFDEEFDHRGFRAADVEWTPPFAWVTPVECEEIMQLAIVRKFVKQCLARIKAYLSLTTKEVYEQVARPDKCTMEQIDKTQRVIKHVLQTVFKEQQADDYRYDR